MISSLLNVIYILVALILILVLLKIVGVAI